MMVNPAAGADSGNNRTPRRCANSPGHGRHPVEGIDMADHTTGWVTFQTIRTAGGQVLLVQKRDGSTRTIVTIR